MQNEDVPLVAGVQNWPMYRLDPAHSGVMPGNLSFPMKLAWRNSIPLALADMESNVDNPSSPVVADGVAYFCTGRRLYAVSTETGAVKWKYPDDRPLTSLIKSTPLIGEDLVYFGGGDGKLYAIKKDTGRHVWSFYTKGIINSPAVIYNDVLYVGCSDDHLYALDPKTGDMKWRGGFRTRDDVSTSPAFGNGLVYFVSDDMIMYAAVPETGRVKWMVHVGASSQATTPVVVGPKIYLAVGNVLECLNAMSGRLEFTVPMAEDITTTPVVSDGIVYYGCRNGKLYAVTTQGKLKWKTPVALGSVPKGAPVIAGNSIILGATKGLLVAVDKNTGAIRWKYIVNANSPDTATLKYTDVTGSPAIADGNLYVLSDDGTLSAFKPSIPDSTGPQVSAFQPARDSIMNGEPPVQIAAIIGDPGSGINPETISLVLDDEKIDSYKFKPETGVLWYRTPRTQPIRPLSDGRHKVTLTMADWAGNVTTMSWMFNVDNRIAKVQQTTDTTKKNQGMPGMMGGMPGMGGLGGGMLGGGGMPR